MRLVPFHCTDEKTERRGTQPVTQPRPGAISHYLFSLTPCIYLVSGCLRACVSWYPFSCHLSISGYSRDVCPSLCSLVKCSLSQQTSGAGCSHQPAPAAPPCLAPTVFPESGRVPRLGSAAVSTPAFGLRPLPADLTGAASRAHISDGPSEERAVDAES